MTDLDRKNMIAKAYRLFAGTDEIDKEYCLALFNGLKNAPDAVFKETIERAAFVYDGKQKIPQISFWMRHKNDVWHSMKTFFPREEKYVKPDEETREQVAAQAAAIAAKFAAMSGGSAPTPKPKRTARNPVQKPEWTI